MCTKDLSVLATLFDKSFLALHAELFVRQSKLTLQNKKSSYLEKRTDSKSLYVVHDSTWS